MSEQAVGEVWRIRHCRKGELVVKVDRDVDETWVDVELVSGRPKYLSEEGRMTGPQEPGEILRMRKEFMVWVKRLEVSPEA